MTASDGSPIVPAMRIALMTTGADRRRAGVWRQLNFSLALALLFGCSEPARTLDAATDDLGVDAARSDAARSDAGNAVVVVAS